MRGVQDDARRLAGLESFLPTRCAQAPAVPGFETCNAILRQRGRKIVAARLRKIKKFSGGYDADRVAAEILYPRVAATVAIEAMTGSSEQGSSRSPNTLRGSLRGPSPLLLSSLSIARSSQLDRHSAMQRPYRPQARKCKEDYAAVRLAAPILHD
jgi:hypothetical protein